MKIGIFTDSHYSSSKLTCGCRYNNQSLRKIKEAYDFFEKEKCELVVCLGDLIDKENDKDREVKHLKEIADVITSYAMKTIVLMGNHDCFCFDREEFYAILEKCRPETFCLENKVLWFLDACYTKEGKRYTPPEGNWTDTCLPDLGKIGQELAQFSSESIYIFLHQNVDGNIQEDHRVYNAAEFRALIENDGRVKTVYQGHYHAGMETKQNGIRYVTFPAMCQKEQAYYIENL